MEQMEQMEQIKKSICSGLRHDGKVVFSFWNRWNTFSIEYFKTERLENICLVIYSLIRLIRRSI